LTPADRKTRARLLTAAAVVLLAAAVLFIYRDAARSAFFNDDYHWLQNGRAFDAASLLRIDRYARFYRPVVEVYFAIGTRLFGCDPRPFHLLAIALHLLMALLVFLFGRALTGRPWIGALGAFLFAVQPGYVEAVAWVSAISEQLAAIFFVLTLWLHLRFLAKPGAGRYALALAAFALCHLTHESAATLLPMMVALEAALLAQAGTRVSRQLCARSVRRYVPFALLLGAWLLTAYAVSTRMDLVQEGHYRIGWHAVRHALDYVVSLYVGKRSIASYALILAVCAVLVVRGTPRARFFLAWMLVTLVPFSFFTWGNAGRYLYLPAAGFALLLAEGIGRLHEALRAPLPRRAAFAITAAAALGIAVRFGVFATRGSSDFLGRTRPYEAYVAAIRRLNPPPQHGGVVYVGAEHAKEVPALYRDAAAQAAFCEDGIRAEVR
jgi:hypothetical protein